MARRPSLASVSSSVASSSTLSRIAKSPPQAASSLPTGFRTPTSPWPPRSASLSALAQPAEVAKGTDPDDLFTQYSVSEVKNIHQRLRCVRNLCFWPLSAHSSRTPGLMRMLSRRSSGSWLGAFMCFASRCFVRTVTRKHRERYRDLLQASTSIISIAQSTKRVLEALDEMKASIPTADEPHLQRRVSTSEKDGTSPTRLLALALIIWTGA